MLKRRSGEMENMPMIKTKAKAKRKEFDCSHIPRAMIAAIALN